MAREALQAIRVAILAADGFEQIELMRPRQTMRKRGADVDVVSLRTGSIRAVNGLMPSGKLTVDRSIDDVDCDDYDALFIPGGFMSPDLLRQSDRVLRFVQAFDRANKPIASICHGPWVLISAGRVGGRRMTSWPGIRDDLQNAGALWENKAVVRDGNLITSRSPLDLLQFHKALVEHFSRDGEARERRTFVPIGEAAITSIALAAVGYGITRYRRRTGSAPDDMAQPAAPALSLASSGPVTVRDAHSGKRERESKREYERDS
ncbi:MAG TPA: type 1 glutamine amidotransferase domain-containing protein [Gemmatimonas sp.]|nr:type 1 glutamine amidotransferase domain-containing protein [Gemmatimonas sp.]